MRYQCFKCKKKFEEPEPFYIAADHCWVDLCPYCKEPEPDEIGDPK